MKVLTITYQQRFNGCDINFDGSWIDIDYDEDTKCPYSQLHNFVVDEAHDDCNDGGEFEGDLDLLEEAVLNKAQELFKDEFDLIKFTVGCDS